jgi:ribosomal-protein-alanine N-acetyltransferase
MHMNVEGLQVSLRPMVMADVDQVMAIEQVAFPTPWPRDAFVYELTRNRNAVCWVAEMTIGDEDPLVVGSTIIWLGPEGAHVGTLAVHPDCRQRRIGQSLLAKALIESAKRGADQATLEVRVSNTPAQALYRKLGFEPVGRQKNYYADTGEDAIIMLLSPINDLSLAKCVIHQ